MLAAIDTKILYFINKGLSCRALDILMPIATFIGSGEFIFTLAVVIALVFRKKEKALGALLTLAGLTVSYYTVTAIKDLVEKPRPCLSLSDINVFIAEKGFSFPSGHATVAFMAAFILSRYFKNSFWIFLLASLVAVSRVYLGAHYPVDVIAGSFIGLALGYGLSELV